MTGLKASTIKLQKYGTDLTSPLGLMECNSLGWATFLTSNDRKQLNAAIENYEQSIKKRGEQRIRYLKYNGILMQTFFIRLVRWMKRLNGKQGR